MPLEEGLETVNVQDATSGNNLTISASGAAKVDGSAVTQPVSGTVTANQGTTPWTIIQTAISTYTASTSGSAITTTTPQDVFTITGSASKTIKILKMGMSITQTTAATVSASLIKRAANTGGTSTAVTAIPFDSNNSAATATVLQYTANPTPGAASGFFMAKRIFIPTTTSVFNSLVEWDFSTTEAVQRPTLRGTSQTMAINLGGTTVTGANPSFYVIWTEE